MRAFPRLLDVFGDDARFLHIVRDGRDVVTSLHPRDASVYHVSPERWVADTQAGMAVDNPRVLTLRYEDLVLDFEASARQLCNHADLPFVPELLGFPQTARLQNHPAWPRGVRPLSPESIGRWKNSQHQDVVEQLINTPGARTLLERLAYL